MPPSHTRASPPRTTRASSQLPPLSWVSQAGLLQTGVYFLGEPIPHAAIGGHQSLKLERRELEAPLRRGLERRTRIALERATELFIGNQSANQDFHTSLHDAISPAGY